eukprot:1176598-Prymnesium_polylepis.1
MSQDGNASASSANLHSIPDGVLTHLVVCRERNRDTLGFHLSSSSWMIRRSTSRQSMWSPHDVVFPMLQGGRDMNANANLLASQRDGLAEDLCKLPHDVTFTLDSGDSVSGNRMILAARSDVFKTMLYGEMYEGSASTVKLSEISSVCLDAIIEWASTGSVSKSMRTAALKHAGTHLADTVDSESELDKTAIKQSYLEMSAAARTALRNAIAKGFVSTLCELLEASHMYAIPRLEELCCKHLQPNLAADS